MKRILFLFASIALCATGLHTQTTAVTATIQDSDGTLWANAACTATWTGQGNPSTTSGQPFSHTPACTVNGSGVMSVTVTDVAFIATTGQNTWNFCAQPNISNAPAFNCAVVSATGASEDISTPMQAALKVPRVTGGTGVTAYADAEVSAFNGNQYYNVGSVTANNGCRYYGSSAWQACGSGAGGGVITQVASAPSSCPNGLPDQQITATSGSPSTLWVGNGSGGCSQIGSLPSLSGAVAGNLTCGVLDGPAASIGNCGPVSSLLDIAGYFRLNEGSGSTAYDSSGNGASLAWTGSGSNHYGPGVNLPFAGSFDGSTNYLTRSTSSTDALAITGPLTITAWFYPTADTTFNGIVAEGASATNHDYGLFMSSGTLGNMFVYVGGSTGFASFIASTGLALNTWNFVALTADGTTIRLYVNGAQSGTAASTAVGTGVSGTFSIGAEIGTIQYFFPGRIGQVRVIARVLNAGEISDIYKTGS